MIDEFITRPEMDLIKQEARNRVNSYITYNPLFQTCIDSGIISKSDVEYLVLVDITKSRVLVKKMLAGSLSSLEGEKDQSIDDRAWDFVGAITNQTEDRSRERFYDIYSRIADYHNKNVQSIQTGSSREH